MMTREIGSEFWDIPSSEKKNALFSHSVQWFLSGRSALRAIISELKGCHSVAMPSWCCDSMIKPFTDAGIQVLFYPVWFQDGIRQEIDLSCDALLIMDYFGYRRESPELDGYHGVVIRDLTHSVFCGEYTDADYYFGSLRKWCGFWTGGFAWSKSGKHFFVEDDEESDYVHIRKTAMEQKKDYIQRQTEEAGRINLNKDFLKLFESAEERLENTGVYSAADRDVLLTDKLDVKQIREKRRENATVLMGALSENLMFPTMQESDCPLFVPVMIGDGKRDRLKKYLISKQIYCPVHWPISELHRLEYNTKAIYENELSLVCDQRYSQSDMERIIDEIRNFRKGE